MRQRLLPLLVAAAAAAPPAQAGTATAADHSVARIDGVARRAGCGPFCGRDLAEDSFTGTVTTLRGGVPATYPFTSSFVWGPGCDTGSASGTLYFADQAWAFSWTSTGNLLVMTAGGRTGPGVIAYLPEPVARDDAAMSCTSNAAVKAVLAG